MLNMTKTKTKQNRENITPHKINHDKYFGKKYEARIIKTQITTENTNINTQNQQHYDINQ